eukprot:8271568-Karenia_brevis.AAC.1
MSCEPAEMSSSMTVSPYATSIEYKMALWSGWWPGHAKSQRHSTPSGVGQPAGSKPQGQAAGQRFG